MCDDTISSGFDVEVVNELLAIFNPRGTRPVLDERPGARRLQKRRDTHDRSRRIDLVLEEHLLTLVDHANST